MARPSKLNEELISLMASKLKKGLPVSSCCDLLGITQPSYNNWMRQGEEDAANDIDSLFCAFFLAIKKARAEFEESALEDIRLGNRGWQGAAWILERTSSRYVPKQEIDAGPDGKVNVIIGGKVKEVKTND